MKKAIEHADTLPQKENYLQSVYKVIFYIEQNYGYELTLEELASVAGFSKYHFHRIFKSITGETLGDYIRRVRLSSTTLKLKTNQKITHIAMNSGYETNASFSKAFKKHFGVTPKAFSKNAKTKKGNNVLNPEIIEIKDIELLYVRATGAYHQSVEESWNKIIEFAYKNNLSGKIKARYGIAHDNPNVIESDKIRYDACIETDNVDVEADGEIASKIITGGRYAKFLYRGSYEDLDKAHEAVSNWIIDSAVVLRDTPVFHKYLDLDPRGVEPASLQTEIYVPIC
jgi:AraC family transcriptional regulator